MKPQHILLSLLGGTLLPLSLAAQMATGNVSGAYGSGGFLFIDNNVGAGTTPSNFIEGNAYPGGAPSGVVSLDDYRTRLTAAFNGGYGGVITFDSTTFVPKYSTSPTPAVYESDPFSSFTAQYGAGFTATMTISKPATTGTQWRVNATVANQTGVSGGFFLGGANSGSHQFRFGTAVDSFAITALWRDANRTYTPTIYFNDNTSVSLTAFSQAGTNPSAGTASQGSDLFFGFVAPTGKLITGFDLVGNGFVRFDDLAFTVIPEPSSFAALAGLVAVGAAVSRRRRRA